MGPKLCISPVHCREAALKAATCRSRISGHGMIQSTEQIVIHGNCSEATVSIHLWYRFDLERFPRAWTYRVLNVLVRHEQLVSLNAYVSTLGGGHFMCRHLASARRCAETQIRVARWLGNQPLEARCWMHMAYNCMYAENFSDAERILKLLRRVAVRLEVRAVWEILAMSCARRLSPVRLATLRAGSLSTTPHHEMNFQAHFYEIIINLDLCCE